MKFSWRRVLRVTTRIVAIAVILLVGLLYFFQARLIYHSRPYGRSYAILLPKNGVELNYDTSQGRQRSFYIPPAGSEGGAPEQLWVLFCGNGSLALEWDQFVRQATMPRTGWLLVEYPGYGLSEGKPSPASILESSEKAYGQLATKLGVEPGSLEKNVNVMGHSLGCASALQFAGRHAVRNVVLVAPFTCTRDMAQHWVGWPLCFLCRHNFDNRARLFELAARAAPPRVTLFHGTDDEVIPFAMGRSLAGAFPKMIDFHPVKAADHMSVLDLGVRQIYEAMGR